MSTSLQQTGAPDPGNEMAQRDDMWEFLGTHQGSAISAIRDALRESSVITGPLDFQCCNSANMAELFISSVGFLGNAIHTNPFLRQKTNDMDVFCSEHSVKTKEKLTRIDCEQMLRDIAVAQFDSVSAMIILLRIANDAMLWSIKRSLVASFERHQKFWNSWKNYSGLESLSDSMKTKAKADFQHFWNAADSLFSETIKLLKELSNHEETESNDIEKLLKRWRDVTSYFREENSWEAVLDRERIIFSTSSVLCDNISWEVRYKLLMNLMSREEMGITQAILDLKLLELELSTDYEEWISIIRLVLRVAVSKGLSYRGIPKKKPEQPQKNEIPQQKGKPFLEAKNENPKKWCEYHKSHSHSTEECRVRKSDTPAKTLGNCYICGDSTHWANKCPKKAPPQISQPETTNPDPQVKGYSKYGRALKQTKPFSLNTQGKHVSFELEDDAEGNDDNECDSDELVDANERYPVCNHVTTNRELGLKTESPMPCVEVIVEDLQDTRSLTGLIDTGSNLSYISRHAFELINTQFATKKVVYNLPQSFQVQTMNGTNRRDTLMVTELTIAIVDTAGEMSAFRPMKMIIHEDLKIPGGYDFLLSCDWVIDQQLDIQGRPEGYEILLPRSKLNDTETNTGDVDTNISLHSIQFDAPEILDDLDDFNEPVQELALIVEALPEKAVATGPLSRQVLEDIQSRIHDPPLKLIIKESQIDPPVRETGFTSPISRQEKLFELLNVLESQKIIRQVPRGTGRYVSPGYAVKKSGDRIRLVVKYCSLNDRLQAPAGVRHHSPVEWMHQLPSWGKYFSVLDVKDAFYRVSVDKASRTFLNMSIWSPSGCREYEWLKMPQGLSPSPSYWCALIESTISSLSHHLRSCPEYQKVLDDFRILIYVDDILVVGRNKEVCSRISDVVHQVLSYNKMYLPDAKIQYCQESVEIMGLRLHQGKIYPNAITVDKVRNLKKPRDKNELISALGLLNYVRKSLPSQSDPSSSKIGNLYDLARGKGFNWMQKHEDAWDELVIKFNEGLPISCFSLEPGVENVDDWTLVIQSDASNEYLGFVTMIIPRVSSDLLDNPRLIKVTDFKETLRIINIGSKRLQSSERLYVPHDREAYGIFWSLHSNRSLIYLFGEVVLQTDNKTALARYTTNSVVDASVTRGRRWIRWISDISDLLFSKSRGGRAGMVRFCHLKGPDNGLADYLSRHVLEDIKTCEVATQTEEVNDENISLTTYSLNEPDLQETFAQLLNNWEVDTNSEYIKKIKFHDIHAFLSNREINVSPARKRVIEQVCSRRFSVLPNGSLLFHNNSHPVIVVPDIQYNERPLRVEIVRLYHEGTALSCHRAELATRSVLRRTFWWPSMDRDVSQWISSCVPCIARKGQNFSGTFNPRKLQHPNQLLVCDWLGPYNPSFAGYRYLLVLVDAFSSYSIALPYRNKSSENVADGLLQWTSLLGCPEKWTSDNDSTFVSETIQHLRSLMGIQDEVSPSYSPPSQGAVERVVRVLKEGIEVTIEASMNSESVIDWPTLVKACIFNSNSVERFGGISPFEVLFGRKPIDPFMATFGSDPDRIRSDLVSYDEYVDRLKEKILTIRDYWSSKSMEIKNRASDRECSGMFDNLEPNDLCVRVSYISGRRMTHGTVRINSKIGSNTYRVIDENGNLIKCHGYQLLKIFDHPHRQVATSTTRPNLHDVDPDDYYIIEKVLDFDPQRGYLVKWANFPSSSNSWQKATDMPAAFRKEMAKVRAQRKHFS